MNGYNLTRNWYNFKFENPDKVKSIHSDFYFYIVDLWNRLGQKEKFGLPTAITMENLNIGSRNTYYKVIKELAEFGFIKMISESTNQHQSRVIALSKFEQAGEQALDQAHIQAREQTPEQTPEHIIKQLNKETKEQKNNIDARKLKFASTLEIHINTYGKDLLNDFYKYWTEPNKSKTKFRQELEKTWSLDRRLETWAKNDKNFKKPNSQNQPVKSFSKNR